jgi:GT2 family glycosyltransferase
VAVGVIVPVRGPAPYLVEALESVFLQDPAPDAVVVVDDGSRPPIVGGDTRCVWMRLDDPAGVAAARAAGAAALNTDLIALADADDAWGAGKLAAQVEALDAHPEAALCFGRAEVIGPDGRPTGERLPELAPGLHPPTDLARDLFERNAIPASSVLVRREALFAVGGFDTGRALPAGSDWELWLRLVAAGHSFVCEPQARIRYRRHAAALTSNVARLAQAGLVIHELHGELVDPDVHRRMKARDLTSLARGRIRERRWADAREALREAAAIEPPGVHERLLAVAAAIPGVRSLLGHRDPYRAAAS